MSALPAGALDDLTRDQLAALVEVLAAEADPARLLAAVLAASVAGAPPPEVPRPPRKRHLGKWERADDGVVDEIAVGLVASGEAERTGRVIPLSQRERLLAAARIVKAGGGVWLICERLHVSGTVAAELHAQVIPAAAAVLARVA